MMWCWFNSLTKRSPACLDLPYTCGGFVVSSSVERAVRILGEQVVGGQVHHGGADVVAGDGQVARAKGVDLVGLVGVLVGLGVAGQRRAVDDGVGAARLGEVQHLVQVRHVDLDVAGHDLVAGCRSRKCSIPWPIRPAAPVIHTVS